MTLPNEKAIVKAKDDGLAMQREMQRNQRPRNRVIPFAYMTVHVTIKKPTCVCTCVCTYIV